MIGYCSGFCLSSALRSVALRSSSTESSGVMVELSDSGSVVETVPGRILRAEEGREGVVESQFLRNWSVRTTVENLRVEELEEEEERGGVAGRR